MSRVIVTGGAGFIGSALVRHLVKEGYRVLNIDKLTYAGNLANLTEVTHRKAYRFAKVDICERASLLSLFNDFQPDGVFHLAAESHVDRSIDAPIEFYRTNVIGTLELLEASRVYLAGGNRISRPDFRFIHISTDEVYGDLPPTGLFSEDSPHNPSSPYSASKSASDMMVRSWFRTFGFPAIVTNCSNNYGPYHFPEKLIPLMIVKCLKGQDLPVYGDGSNIRDWLFVNDHVEALRVVFEKGRLGEVYNIGGQAEKTNLEVVRQVCDSMDALMPSPSMASRRDLISFVADRPGHDKRYAVDISKIKRELGWSPKTSFEDGISYTVKWFVDNYSNWVLPLLSDSSIVDRKGGVSAEA